MPDIVNGTIPSGPANSGPTIAGTNPWTKLSAPTNLTKIDVNLLDSNGDGLADQIKIWDGGTGYAVFDMSHHLVKSVTSNLAQWDPTKAAFTLSTEEVTASLQPFDTVTFDPAHKFSLEDLGAIDRSSTNDYDYKTPASDDNGSGLVRVADLNDHQFDAVIRGLVTLSQNEDGSANLLFDFVKLSDGGSGYQLYNTDAIWVKHQQVSNVSQPTGMDVVLSGVLQASVNLGDAKWDLSGLKFGVDFSVVPSSGLPSTYLKFESSSGHQIIVQEQLSADQNQQIVAWTNSLNGGSAPADALPPDVGVVHVAEIAADRRSTVSQAIQNYVENRPLAGFAAGASMSTLSPQEGELKSFFFFLDANRDGIADGLGIRDTGDNAYHNGFAVFDSNFKLLDYYYDSIRNDHMDVPVFNPLTAVAGDFQFNGLSNGQFTSVTYTDASKHTHLLTPTAVTWDEYIDKVTNNVPVVAMVQPVDLVAVGLA